jgi:putative FmdB family regulatory protein
MPIYEYFCTACNSTFEKLRPAQQADVPVPCPGCQHVSSQRILSLFASSVKTAGDSYATAPAAFSGGGCCGGACGCHH